MAKQTGSIARGVSVLGITGIVCKVIGVLYSIPLARILGDTGLGLFQTVYPTYNLFLTLSSAGLPVAVSRLVAHYLAKGDPQNAKRSFKFALLLLFCIGSAFSLIMLVSNHMLVRLVGVEEASHGFYAIAPCVAIVCVLSAFRGFVQGQQNMVPTAVSQVIEQVGKVALSLPLAAIGMRVDIATGASNALMGITMVEAIALSYMAIRYWLKRKDFSSIPQLSDEPAVPGRWLVPRLVAISVPITISACIIPLSSFIDSALMVNRMVSSGVEHETATALYGIFSGMVIRLINIPTALALAISMSLVPAISAVKAVENKSAIRSESDTGIRYAFVIGFPCSIGMSMLSENIIRFFYLETLSSERIIIASQLLSMSALTCVLFTVVQATSSILQGLHRQRIPMYTMIAGVVCKIVLNFVLIGTPGINIHGGPVASLVCYTVAMVPNLYFCCKYAGMRFNLSGWIIRPGIATLAMAAVVSFMRLVLPVNRILTIIEVIAGFGIYAVVALADRALTKDDLRMFVRRRGK